MRKIFCFFLVSVLVGCSSLESPQLIYKDGLAYKKKSDVPYTGKYVRKEKESGVPMSDGPLKVEERNYKNGKLNGELKEFFNLNIKRSVKFVDGKIEGEEIGYYKNDSLQFFFNKNSDLKIRFKANYKGGILNGKVETYDQNGSLQCTLNYIDGVLDGEFTGNNLNFWKINFIQGKVTNFVTNTLKGNLRSLVVLNGKATFYYPDRKEILSEVNLVNGNQNGELKIYFLNNQIYYSAMYKDGILDGKTRMYNYLGTLILEENYENGVLKSSDEYYDNGVIKNKVKRKNNNGVSEEFNESGKLIATKEFIYDKEKIYNNKPKYDYSETKKIIYNDSSNRIKYDGIYDVDSIHGIISTLESEIFGQKTLYAENEILNMIKKSK